ncbi:HNH endonuclease family protein [Streptomyces thermolineatus]|uniref:HNH endonuclease family protein n=1 Tax=Streptomyces thermolineatus TaxID=44033 RepID=A0ABN3MW68_9ACTN
MRASARRGLVAAPVAAATAVLALLATAPAQAAPPTPVSAATARAYLADLTVTPEPPRTGYSRGQFPHWAIISGTCNTREIVLQRDGTGVVTNASCAATSGSWYSPYDGATWHAASDVDIDHLVPLAEAWDSGAKTWTLAQRRAFANDLIRPELVAVTDDVNEAKSDQDPGTWLPPLTTYRCTYARAWVQVKHHYGLTVDSREKNALATALAAC